MQNPNLAKRNLVTHKVNVNLDVFGTAVLNRVGGHVHCADIITKNNRGSSQGMMELCKKLTDPTALGNSVSDNPILCLSTRARDGGLPIRAP